MKRASVTEAKNGLSALLDRVRHGETVIIEDRGTPIAQISPLTGAASRMPDRDRLTRLERQGVLRPSAPAPPAKRHRQPPARPRRRVSLSELVRRERDEGR
jgi:prevent-host-death family protein